MHGKRTNRTCFCDYIGNNDFINNDMDIGLFKWGIKNEYRDIMDTSIRTAYNVWIVVVYDIKFK